MKNTDIWTLTATVKNRETNEIELETQNAIKTTKAYDLPIGEYLDILIAQYTDTVNQFWLQSNKAKKKYLNPFEYILETDQYTVHVKMTHQEK